LAHEDTPSLPGLDQFHDLARRARRIGDDVGYSTGPVEFFAESENRVVAGALVTHVATRRVRNGGARVMARFNGLPDTLK
jgi:hypothetical protein